MPTFDQFDPNAGGTQTAPNQGIYDPTAGFSGNQPPPPQAQQGAPGGQQWSPGSGPITAQQVSQQYGADPSVAQYWADKINTGGDPNYYIGRIAQDNAGTGPDGPGGVSGGGAAGGSGGNGAPGGNLYANWSPMGQSGAGGGAPAVGQTGATPISGANPYTPTNITGPSPLSLASINQPGAVNAQQVQSGAPVTAQQVQGQSVATPQSVEAQQVQGPQALMAQQLANPTGFQNLTAEQAAAQPGYQFALQQGLGAMQHRAAAKGDLFGGATPKGLNDYANNAATQNYASGETRMRRRSRRIRRISRIRRMSPGRTIRRMRMPMG